jgi:hypothetical protein
LSRRSSAFHLPLPTTLLSSALAMAKTPAIDPVDAFPPSNVTQWEIEELALAKLIPLPEIVGTRLGAANSHPIPNQEEAVVLLPFFIRGLGLPTCNFFRQLLDFYCLELVHLNPNAILQISVFVHLCEAFLGIPPSLDLFCHLFWVKPQPSAASPAMI